MSMLKSAILLSVVMVLLCAVSHSHLLFSIEEQGVGVTQGFFSQSRKILGMKSSVLEATGMFCTCIIRQCLCKVSVYV